ncbi:MAG: radical SAM protein [Methanomassiliicoccales archaeon]|nr:radical SAM protein [Methanomassiliicoccales archaeon]
MTSPSLESFDDPCHSPGRRKVSRIECKTALSPSSLPGLDLTLNPYRGCEHDCVYCYAPYLFRMAREDWSRVGAKLELPRLLAKEAARKRGVIGLSTATDPYQPVEAEIRLTRRCLEELVRARAKVSVLTKSDLVLRDLDLLASLPEVEVGITITTIEDRWAACFESGAPSPSRRLEALRQLVERGIDCYTFIGPILPLVTERRLEDLIGSIHDAGCRRAMTDPLRLRPGMIGRMRALPCASELGEGFFVHCQDQGYLERAQARVVDSCAEHGISVQTAF